MSKLTAKQERFVEEYLCDLNATQAAKRSGYSKKNADKIGSQVLGKTRVAEAIQARIEQRSRTARVSADRVIQELETLGLSNAQDFFTENGNLKSIAALPGQVAACIQSFDVVTRLTGTKNSDGKKEVETVFKVKLHNKLKALELLGRHHGIFSDKIIHEVPEVSESTEEVILRLAEIERELEQLEAQT